MTNDIDEQIMEQMKTSMDEIFEEMKLRLCEMVDRVIDKVFSDFKTIEPKELKSYEELHDTDQVDALSDFSKSPNESNGSNNFQIKGVSSLIQKPSNEDETTKECLRFECYNFVGEHQGPLKPQGNSKNAKTNQYIVGM